MQKMKRGVLIVLMLSAITVLNAQGYKDVLFVGNSYTYQNNLPKTTSDLASSLGDTMNTLSTTGGGLRLKNHASNASLYAQFKQRNWDYIILQEQSQLPSFPGWQVQAEVFPYAEQLCDSIHALQGCTKPLFFMTWGRENGDAQNCQFYQPLCTYEGMTLELRKNYLKMGIDNNAYVSPVGMVWREIRSKWPGINLYDNDGSHPSPAGTYAAACTHYAVIYGKSPEGASYTGGLAASVADSIQKAAARIVFDSLLTWNIIPDSVQANFTFQIQSDSVYFTYSGSNADQVEWDFGDGNMGYGPFASHIYGVSDTFTVTAIARKGCVMDTITKQIITKAAITLNADYNFQVFHDTVMFAYTGTTSDSIHWDFDNTQSDTGHAVTHIYGVADSFDVRLIAFYQGISDTVSKVVVTTLDTVSTVGMQDLVSSEQFTVYPNPVSTELHVAGNREIESLKLIGYDGQVNVDLTNVKSTEVVLETSNFPAGIYVLQLISASGIENITVLISR